MNSKTLQHFIGWLLYLGYDYVDYFTGDDVGFDNTLVIVSYDIIVIFIFYLCYFYMLPWVFSSFSKFKAALAIVLGIVAFIFIRYFIQEVLFLELFGFKNYYRGGFKYFFTDNIWRGFLPVIGATLVFLVERKVENDKKRLELEKEKSKAELANLRSQINPHFLFNTMSFLHAEAFLVDPDLAEMILKLSDVLRHSVESTQKEKVFLEKEINLLKNYIAIFRKRFENKCFVQMNVEGNSQGKFIEPLLLLPFIENAVKHGIFTDEKVPLKINLSVDQDNLNFICTNKINQNQKDPGSGIGIKNVKKRLELLYPEKYKLDINENDYTFTVKLELVL